MKPPGSYKILEETETCIGSKALVLWSFFDQPDDTHGIITRRLALDQHLIRGLLRLYNTQGTTSDLKFVGNCGASRTAKAVEAQADTEIRDRPLNARSARRTNLPQRRGASDALDFSPKATFSGDDLGHYVLESVGFGVGDGPRPIFCL